MEYSSPYNGEITIWRQNAISAQSLLLSKIPKIAMIEGVLAALSVVVVYLERPAVNQAAFEDPNSNANPFASRANTNNEYLKGCKEFQTSLECATGIGNNEEYVQTGISLVHHKQANNKRIV